MRRNPSEALSLDVSEPDFKEFVLFALLAWAVVDISAQGSTRFRFKVSGECGSMVPPVTVQSFT
ncbi:MAG: hypothetical protein M3Q07_06015 [Pseudobdellovibrionaceae bacterium]|nr:hypothetical protein [Pseudobdellovibrionaceae bacterium]